MVLTKILTILLLVYQCEYISATEIQINRVELLNSTYKEGFYNFSELLVTRINRTAYVINLQVMIYLDIDENFEFEVSFHHNRLNNNQYNKMPYRIPRKTICQALDQFYKKLIWPAVKDVSNLPQVKEGEHVCPVKKVYISYI